MPPLTNQELLGCYKAALANWRFEGYVTFKQVPAEWVRKNLPKRTLRGLAQEMHEYVTGGGTVDQQQETRPEWSMHDYHFDLRIRIDGRYIYFETLLFYDDPSDPDDPTIHVVSVHDV